MIYVYALVPAPTELPESSGLDGEHLQIVAVGGVSAVYSELGDRQVKPTPETLWAHDRVVEGLLARGSVLPVRFATCFANVEELEAVLARKREALASGLERVRGCVELAIRVRLRATEVPVGELGGREYLDRQLAVRRHQREIAEDVLAPLGELSFDSVIVTAEPETIKAAYLVQADQTSGFVDQVSRVQDDHGELSLSCTGPWAPYSFAPEGVS